MRNKYLLHIFFMVTSLDGSRKKRPEIIKNTGTHQTIDATNIEWWFELKLGLKY